MATDLYDDVMCVFKTCGFNYTDKEYLYKIQEAAKLIIINTENPSNDHVYGLLMSYVELGAKGLLIYPVHRNNLMRLLTDDPQIIYNMVEQLLKELDIPQLDEKHAEPQTTNTITEHTPIEKAINENNINENTMTEHTPIEKVETIQENKTNEQVKFILMSQGAYESFMQTYINISQQWYNIQLQYKHLLEAIEKTNDRDTIEDDEYKSLKTVKDALDKMPNPDSATRQYAAYIQQRMADKIADPNEVQTLCKSIKNRLH